MKFDVLDLIREPDNYTSAERRLAAAEIAVLLEFLGHAAAHLEAGIQMYPGGPEEPPQPASQWDYEAWQLVGEISRLIAKATGESA